MPLSLEQLRSALDPDEPVHLDPQRVGPGARILIRAVASGSDVLLAAKAVLFAAHLRGDDGREIILDAARSPNPLVRESAAHALGLRRDIPAGIAAVLLRDHDAAVRARAIDALARWPTLQWLRFRGKVRSLGLSDPDPRVRATARSAAQRGRGETSADRAEAGPGEHDAPLHARIRDAWRRRGPPA